jgi:antirestriction protein ArdC
MAATAAGYSSPVWLSFKQAQSFGANVRKGQHGSTVFFASTYTKENEQGEEKDIPFLRAYTVFNASQIDGLPGQFNALSMRREPAARLQAAEDFLDNIGADVRHGGNRAFYNPSQDYIQMLPFEAFEDAVAYYGTSFHEHAHWTGHKDRLDRKLTGQYGTEDYAWEEMSAEMAAVMISADLELRSRLVQPVRASQCSADRRRHQSERAALEQYPRAIHRPASQASCS